MALGKRKLRAMRMSAMGMLARACVVVGPLPVRLGPHLWPPLVSVVTPLLSRCSSQVFRSFFFLSRIPDCSGPEVRASSGHRQLLLLRSRFLLSRGPSQPLLLVVVSFLLPLLPCSRSPLSRGLSRPPSSSSRAALAALAGSGARVIRLFLSSPASSFFFSARTRGSG